MQKCDVVKGRKLGAENKMHFFMSLSLYYKLLVDI
jgi:hypothetical protein